MNSQSLNDIQILIDKLFSKLEEAKTGGEISQYTHALRVQITKKKNLGGDLQERELVIISAIGEITPRRKSSGLGFVLTLVILIVCAYVAYKYFM